MAIAKLSLNSQYTANKKELQATSSSSAGRTFSKFKMTPTPSSSLSLTSSPSTSMKRVVSFEDNIKIIHVAPIDASLKNELFYCRSDYRRFKKESKKIHQMLDQRLSMGSSFSLSCSPNMHKYSSLMNHGSPRNFDYSASQSQPQLQRHRSLSLASFR